MKTERTEMQPKWNPGKPDGTNPQVHNEDITHVLLGDNKWYEIVPQSFKYYVVAFSDKGQRRDIPYVRFRLLPALEEVIADGHTRVVEPHGPLSGKMIEVFPAQVHALAYDGDK